MANRTSKIEKLLEVRIMTTSQVITLFRMKGLLRTSMTCLHCEQSMSERFKRDVIDETSWVCFNSQCSKIYTTVSIRAGSFFEKFRMSLADVWTVILMWSEDTSIAGVVKSFGLSKTTVIKIFAMLREKVSQHLQIDPIRLGGPGIVCQIDESLFCHKQKYHRGRIARAQTWVFGIADTSFKPSKGYMEVVSDRSAETLLEIINRVCRPGSIMYSDKWTAY